MSVSFRVVNNDFDAETVVLFMNNSCKITATPLVSFYRVTTLLKLCFHWVGLVKVLNLLGLWSVSWAIPKIELGNRTFSRLFLTYHSHEFNIATAKHPAHTSGLETQILLLIQNISLPSSLFLISVVDIVCFSTLAFLLSSRTLNTFDTTAMIWYHIIIIRIDHIAVTIRHLEVRFSISLLGFCRCWRSLSSSRYRVWHCSHRQRFILMVITSLLVAYRKNHPEIVLSPPWSQEISLLNLS